MPLDRPFPQGEESITGRGIISAIRLTSFTSVLTITFGVVTNKVIAVVTGTEGVGLLGLYRTISGILTAVLPVGANEIVVQRLSTARQRETIERVLGASLSFFIGQAVLLSLLAFLAAPTVARLLFPGADPSTHLWEVRLVISLSLGVMALQSITACLSGLFRVREVNRVNLITSALTVLTVYPFLLLGRPGLALVIGCSCSIGAALGAHYLRRVMASPLFSVPRPRTWREFRVALPISPWLALQPLLNTGSALAVQVVLSRHYGLPLLGHYNAAAMLETTAITVLMSSMRSYYLPGLGRLNDFGEKKVFVNRVLAVLLVLLLGGTTVLVFAAPTLVRLFFSDAFGPAADLIRILSISMVGQVVVWCGAMFLLHGADYKTYVQLDFLWAVVRVVGTVSCAILDLPVAVVAWVHAGSYALSAVCYVLAIRVRYRAFIIDGMNGLFLGLVLVFLVGSQLFLVRLPVEYQIGVVLMVVASCLLTGRAAWHRMRG